VQLGGTWKKLRWVAAAAVLLAVGGVVIWVVRQPASRHPLRLDEYLTEVEAGHVASATIHDADRSVTGELADGTRYKVTVPQAYLGELTTTLERTQPPVRLEARAKGSRLAISLLSTVLPLALLAVLVLVMLHRFQGGAAGPGFSRGKARKALRTGTTVTFADVAGADEAVDELTELAEFLRDPGRFEAMGARIPKGVLLCGPPGTGKTLLARAVAGEARATFYAISGSDFVEMFVGVGASRVRELFKQAADNAPAIIFIDEIDAVGRKRGSGHGGGHDEREQTLNQLLVEMDGFDNRRGVIVLAATNRPDVLDTALLRPGRFDRHVHVELPDLVGRAAILDVHGRGKPLDNELSLRDLARRTPGFSGADLSNLLNEAAILAVRRDRPSIGRAEVEEAVDRVVAGPARRARVISDEEKWVIAYHEAGHALTGHLLPTGDPVQRVSILARGRALGWTLAVPRDERRLHNRRQLHERMVMLLGGRVAEELIFADVTSGASDDIERATEIARLMVSEYGMSETIGPRRLAAASSGGGGTGGYSEAKARIVDSEIDVLVAEARVEARRLLVEHRDTLDRLAEALVEQETLDETDLATLFADLAPASHGGRLGEEGLSEGLVTRAALPPAPPDARPGTSLPASQPEG
jgi:cell division protease FtsH